jgi:hypothetical protein
MQSTTLCFTFALHDGHVFSAFSSSSSKKLPAAGAAGAAAFLGAVGLGELEALAGGEDVAADGLAGDGFVAGFGTVNEAPQAHFTLRPANSSLTW